MNVACVTQKFISLVQAIKVGSVCGHSPIAFDTITDQTCSKSPKALPSSQAANIDSRIGISFTPLSARGASLFRRRAFYSVSALLLLCAPVHADEQPTQKLNDAAQAAFDEGKFKKAELSWARAVKTMEENGQKDSYLEVCLKKLGQTKKRLQQTVEAYQTLMRAFDMCNLLGVQDQELADELTDLSTSYRAVDVAALGDGTATALRKANVGGVGLVKTATGTMTRRPSRKIREAS